MKIKKLSIQGFKSFVDRVVLDFGSEPAAVIGPNGCGKSNVIDAIRWVTGEQNPRHLRGRQMEDIIFNGSEGRKPVGMAEVVLTFSNERAKAPIRFASFSEIEVARRLYRSGESEYYINKIRCRLRDVVDLFTDTGIGKEGYSIVEQGQVSWLVNARPEERRVLFEEAAGINRFKHKRDTAIRRLESTKENLVRVGDIISEVKRQLNSLNRQAKKAERYKAAKDELKEADIRLASMEYAGLLEKSRQNSKRIKEAEDGRLAITTEKSGLEDRRDEALEALAAVEQRYRAVKEKVFNLEKDLASEERSSELAGMRAGELRRNLERLAGEIEEIQNKKNKAGTGIAETRASLDETLRSMEGGQKGLDELNDKLKGILHEREVLTSREAVLKSRLVQCGATLSDIRHSLQSAIGDEERAREQEAKSGSAIVEAKGKILSLRAPLDILKKDKNASDQQGKSLESSLGGLRARLGGLEARRESLLGELESAKEARAAGKARLTTLLEMEKNFENIHGGARSILKQGNLRGVHGIVADFIETNPGYEKAVEAALAERLEYVIVEGHGEGMDAIGFLKGNAGGRGSFVPLKDLRPSPSAVPAGFAANPALRPLAKEIRVKEGYNHIIEALLGDAIIVKDMSEAIEVWHTDGIFNTIVTLEGERLGADGIITGGGLGSSDGGILQRRGEIRQIQDNLTGLETRLGELTEALGDIDTRLSSGRNELDELTAGLHRVELERLNTESEIKRQENEIEGLLRLKEDLQREQDEAGETIRGIREKKDGLAREREDLEGAVKKDEEALKSLLMEITSIEEKKAAINSAVTTSQVELARVTERRDALEARLIEGERLIKELSEVFDARVKETALAERELEEKNQEAASIGAKLKTLYTGLESARLSSAEEQEALTTVTSRISELDKGISALTEKARKLEELKGTLGFGLKEIELQVTSLDEKMDERYGLCLDDLPIIPAGDETSGAGEEEKTAERTALKERRDTLHAKILAMGEVSLSALDEYRELDERHTFLLAQQEDLTRSTDGLLKAIARINKTSRAKFSAAFEEINTKFKENFPKFFRGGKAELKLTDEANILESGIEIVAQPPGKRLQNITLLSGGEKALTAVSLIFSIFLIKPSPFCLLDEVDAPLDEANIDRFNTFVQDISHVSQFILITHNKRTMEVVDRLYGITMEEPGVSKVVSVKF